MTDEFSEAADGLADAMAMAEDLFGRTFSCRAEVPLDAPRIFRFKNRKLWIACGASEEAMSSTGLQTRIVAARALPRLWLECGIRQLETLESLREETGKLLSWLAVVHAAVSVKEESANG